MFQALFMSSKISMSPHNEDWLSWYWKTKVPEGQHSPYLTVLPENAQCPEKPHIIVYRVRDIPRLAAILRLLNRSLCREMICFKSIGSSVLAISHTFKR